MRVYVVTTTELLLVFVFTPSECMALSNMGLTQRLIKNTESSLFVLNSVLLISISVFSFPVLVGIQTWMLKRCIYKLSISLHSVIILVFSVALLIVINDSNNTTHYSQNEMVWALFLTQLQSVVLLCAILMLSYMRLGISMVWARRVFILTALLNFTGRMLTIYNAFSPQQSRIYLRSLEIIFTTAGYGSLLVAVRCFSLKNRGDSSNRPEKEDEEDHLHLLHLLSICVIFLVGGVLMVVYPSYDWTRLDEAYFVTNSSAYLIFFVLLNHMYAKAFVDQANLEEVCRPTIPVL